MSPIEKLLREENSLLRERVADLEEQVNMLKMQVVNTSWEVPLELGLTTSENRVLSCLYHSKGHATKENIFDALYTDNDPNYVRGMKIVDVFICKMRKKLKKFDLSIITIWGSGYILDEDSKAKLKEWGTQVDIMEAAQ
jgi:two-component system cell cycle response regulator CtrA